MNKIKGSVSIYLCMILLSVIVLISVLAERARVSIIQSKCKAVTYMATESVLAGYGKQIFEDYALLLAWENISTEEILKEYMQANINKADIKGTGTNFMDTNMVDIVECDIKYVSDDNGKLFLDQVKKYVKYAGITSEAEKLVETFTNYTEKNKTEINKEEDKITLIADKNSDELQSIVKDIKERTETLKNVEELEKEYVAFAKSRIDKNINKISKKYKKIVIILKDKEETVGKIINLINDYKKKKEIFLRDTDYTQDGEDYLENNLEILEKLRDEIIDVKELNVSKISQWNSQNQTIINTCEEKLTNILGSVDKLVLNKVTEADRENATVFEYAKNLMSKGIIALVTEDTENISKKAISTLNLPSNLKVKQSDENLLDKSNLLVYSNLKFGNYLNEGKNSALKYEMEYLIGGKDTDSDNLAATIKKIVGIRNVINMGILLLDNEKMKIITSIAVSVATVTGVPFMEIVAKTILIEAWALAESIYEMKSLLKENKIPIIKSKNDWNTDLENLLKEPKRETSSKGVDYETYCNILLMLQPSAQISYRMMDLIQENIQLRYNSNFLIERCFCAIDLKASFKVKPLFMAMPWSLNITGDKSQYKFQVRYENSY